MTSSYPYALFLRAFFLLKMQEIEVVMKEKIGYNLLSVFYATAIMENRV